MIQSRCQVTFGRYLTWTKLTAVHPKLGRPFYNIGNYKMQLGQLQDAVHLYEKAIRKEPDYIPAIANCAIAYQRMRDTPNAIKYYNRAITGVLYGEKYS